MLPIPCDAPPADDNPDKIVYLAFTSGTTGMPKGVLHSDNTLLANGRAMVHDWHHDERTVLFSHSPLSHHIGTVALEQSLVAGCEVVVNDLPPGMKPLDWILETGATYVMGVPTHAMDILADMKGRGLSTLGAVKTFYMAGSTIPPETARAFLDMDVKPQNIYGMTENGSHQYTLPDDDASTITSTCGKACAGYETRLWDQENPDREAGPGEIGEIGTRGALLTLGYFDNQAATENSFNAGGWFMSGDLGRFDENGNLQIVGRKKDLIIRGGHNIHPADIENRALKHPGGAQGGGVSRGRRAARRARVPRRRAAGRGAARGHGVARALACRRAFEIRHARVLHRDGDVSAHRERQDPEARARRMDESRARFAAPRSLHRPRKILMAIELTRVDELAVVTLNRPDALNALSFSLIRDLGQALDEVAQSGARALLITGVRDADQRRAQDRSRSVYPCVSDARRCRRYDGVHR